MNNIVFSLVDKVHSFSSLNPIHPANLRNPRQQLHHNAAHMSSNCQPESFVRQGAAENHNHDREVIMRERMRTRLKKKMVTDNNCKKADRAATDPGLGTHTHTDTLAANCHSLHEEWRLLCTEYLNVPLSETAC